MKRAIRSNVAKPECAYVVFSGRSDLPWLRLLKPGFRHCFLAMRQQGCWVLYEPMSNRTEISIAAADDGQDIAGWMRQMGFTVLPAVISRESNRPAPWGPFTCVEAVKRVLGIHRRGILTPWHLHCFLREQNMKIVDKDEKLGYMS